MTATEPSDITMLLAQVNEGRAGASDELFRRVYDQLRIIAKARLADCRGGTMAPTVLVHEAYIKLFGTTNPNWTNRRHFFWAAARAMRDILVDAARKRHALKRGGGRVGRPLDDGECADRRSEEYLALDVALEQLALAHPDHERVVMFRYFAGLDVAQTAVALGVSESTVARQWRFARAWLLEKLGEDGAAFRRES